LGWRKTGSVAKAVIGIAVAVGWAAHGVAVGQPQAPCPPLAQQSGSGGTLYEQRCAGCHGAGASFAKASLVEINGEVSGRTTRRPLAECLRTHGRLNQSERELIVDWLAKMFRSSS
jgi:mono/diheme cytochrome c family protein